MFKLEIVCDNAAFGDTPLVEVARILRELAIRIEDENAKGFVATLRDINGNKVGFAEVVK